MKNIVFILSLVTFSTCQTSKIEPCIEVHAQDCICTKQYAPVCGCNGKTYGNSCEAECHGIDEYTKGECTD